MRGNGSGASQVIFRAVRVGVAGTAGPDLDPMVVSPVKLVFRDDHDGQISALSFLAAGGTTLDGAVLPCGAAILNNGTRNLLFQTGYGEVNRCCIRHYSRASGASTYTETDLFRFDDTLGAQTPPNGQSTTTGGSHCGQYAAINAVLPGGRSNGYVWITNGSDGTMTLHVSDSTFGATSGSVGTPKTFTLGGGDYFQHGDVPNLNAVLAWLKNTSTGPGWTGSTINADPIYATLGVSAGGPPCAVWLNLIAQPSSPNVSTSLNLMLTPPPWNGAMAWKPDGSAAIAWTGRVHDQNDQNITIHARVYTTAGGWGQEYMIAPVGAFTGVSAGAPSLGMYDATNGIWVLACYDGPPQILSSTHATPVRERLERYNDHRRFDLLARTEHQPTCRRHLCFARPPWRPVSHAPLCDHRRNVQWAPFIVGLDANRSQRNHSEWEKCAGPIHRAQQRHGYMFRRWRIPIPSPRHRHGAHRHRHRALDRGAARNQFFGEQLRRQHSVRFVPSIAALGRHYEYWKFAGAGGVPVRRGQQQCPWSAALAVGNWRIYGWAYDEPNALNDVMLASVTNTIYDSAGDQYQGGTLVGGTWRAQRRCL